MVFNLRMADNEDNKTGSLNFMVIAVGYVSPLSNSLLNH
jgi:hypothetical protein